MLIFYFFFFIPKICTNKSINGHHIQFFFISCCNDCCCYLFIYFIYLCIFLYVHRINVYRSEIEQISKPPVANSIFSFVTKKGKKKKKITLKSFTITENQKQKKKKRILSVINYLLMWRMHHLQLRIESRTWFRCEWLRWYWIDEGSFNFFPSSPFHSVGCVLRHLLC